TSKPSAYPATLACCAARSGGNLPTRYGVTIDQSSNVVCGLKRREPSASLPESSCTMSHLAISAALALMPPAGLTLSLPNGEIGRTRPSISACGVAMLPPPPPAAAEWRTLLPVIPTRARMRDETKSSHVSPETASMTSPATLYSTLSYAYAERKLVSGLM